MASNTNISFTDFQTIIPASWANFVNSFVNYFPATSIAQLRTVSKAQIAQVFAMGYYTANDGGGGPYILDPLDTSSADNGGTIIVANDGGRWKLNLTGPVSVKQFGAHGDGVSDDTAEFQACLNWRSITGGDIYIPAGTYIISSVLTWTASTALRMVGAGRTSAILKSPTTTNVSILNFSGIGILELSDLGFYGPTSSTGGTLITCSVNHVFNRLDMVQFYNGMNLSGNVGVIDACNIGTNGQTGPVSNNSIGILVNGYEGGLLMSNCTAFVPSAGVTPTAGIEVISCGALLISNCNIIRQGVNLLLNPPNGNHVASVQVINSFLDSGQIANVLISPQIGGIVTRFFMNQTECSSSLTDGISIVGTNGTVNGVMITAAQANFCGGNGLIITGANVTNVDINGGEFTNNVSSGLAVTNGASCRATGVVSGPIYGGSGNGTGFLCDSSSSLHARGCEAFTNSSANFNVPASAIIQNCIGFVSMNTGNASIPNTGTAIIVGHGLSGTPSASQIQLTPTGATGTNPIFLDTTSITSSSFTVRCASAASGAIPFAWRATCNGQQ